MFIIKYLHLLILKRLCLICHKNMTNCPNV